MKTMAISHIMAISLATFLSAHAQSIYAGGSPARGSLLPLLRLASQSRDAGSRIKDVPDDAMYARMSSKFIMGTPATDEYKYVVSLIDLLTGAHICGGVLIGPRHVLTAAQCVQWRRYFPPYIHIGGTNLYIPGEIRRVTRIILHPQWTRRIQMGNDLAIVVLNKNSSFQPIQLPERRANVRLDDQLLGLGWGRSSPRGSYDDVLQEAVLEHVRKDLCWPGNRVRALIMPGMLCLGGNGVDMCYGDQGSPVIKKSGEDSEEILVGISSYKEGGCASLGTPSIYTDVGSHVSWIASIVQN